MIFFAEKGSTHTARDSIVILKRYVKDLYSNNGTVVSMNTLVSTMLAIRKKVEQALKLYDTEAHTAKEI
jgi:hypothetical protein